MVEPLLHTLDFQPLPGQSEDVSTHIFFEVESREMEQKCTQNTHMHNSLLHKYSQARATYLTKLAVVYLISHLWQDGVFCFYVGSELSGMVSEGCCASRDVV